MNPLRLTKGLMISSIASEHGGGGGGGGELGYAPIPTACINCQLVSGLYDLVFISCT